jgi:CRISPR-associated protein Csd1
MSWIQNLVDTYDKNAQNIGDTNDTVPLLPLCHTIQNAQIQIVIDLNGNFLRAAVIKKANAPTIIPCTESSSSRAGKKPKGHPLCDSLQFVAGDFCKFGGIVTSGYAKEPGYPYNEFLDSLNNWCNSVHKHAKIISVLEYVKQGKVIEDLISQKILHLGSDNLLIKKSTKEQLKLHYGSIDNVPEIFGLIQPDQSEKTIDQGDAFVRWCIETPGDPQSEVWNDKTLWKCWADYYAEQESSEGLCYVLGCNTRLGKTHPKRIRKGNDNSKLISIPSDKSFITFQGRFTDERAEQASGISFEASQKAHSALRWLIGRKQSFKNGDQVIVSWAVSGQTIPPLLTNSYDLFAFENEAIEQHVENNDDTGQSFAQKLNKYIAGYSVKLSSTNSIVLLGLDSATPGRLSITYYRELTGSEFLSCIEKWHSDLAWKQSLTIENVDGLKKSSKTISPICAPAPKDIAVAAYGSRIDDKLKKATVERILSCIIDGLPIPQDFVNSIVRRACNPAGLKYADWKEILGIACSLYKGYYLRNPNEKRSYSMTLELERNTRDYLFGRLLAAADGLEKYALNFEKSGPKEDTRQTNAARFMQQFAIKPCSTWKIIELSLCPYIAKLGNRSGKYCKTITKVTAQFEHDDYISDKPLSGEFLLGYHCQREAFYESLKVNVAKENETEIENY